MSEKTTIQFEGGTHPSLEVVVGTPLSEVLDGDHSPVFFGCKSGNCGTCLVEVDEVAFAKLPPPNDEERETLATLASGLPRARLACQLVSNFPVTLRYLH